MNTKMDNTVTIYTPSAYTLLQDKLS